MGMDLYVYSAFSSLPTIQSALTLHDIIYTHSYPLIPIHTYSHTFIPIHTHLYPLIPWWVKLRFHLHILSNYHSHRFIPINTLMGGAMVPPAHPQSLTFTHRYRGSLGFQRLAQGHINMGYRTADPLLTSEPVTHTACQLSSASWRRIRNSDCLQELGMRVALSI